MKMSKKRQNEISDKTQQEAMVIAKHTQRPGQTKEQTRLIAMGIEKGIAEYKKGVKNKQRQTDKAKKKQQKLRQQELIQEAEPSGKDLEEKAVNNSVLPWSLLIISWIAFVVYHFC